MRKFLAMMSFALAWVVVSSTVAWGGGERVEMHKLRGGQDNVVRVQGGKFLPVTEGLTGWKSDIPYVSKEYRKSGERESSLTIDLSGVQAFSPTRGTLEMWVQFDGSIVDEQADTLFSFTDNTQTDLFTVYLNWFSRFDPAKTSLLFTGKAYTPDGAPVYGRYALFDRGIRKGQWVHVALTWGPGGEAENLVYLNGKPAGSYYVRSVEEGVAGVAQAVKRGGNLSSYISGARYLVIGSDARSNWVFRHGLIGDVALHDEVLTKFDLSKYKPVIRELAENTFRVAGISGKLVAGDSIEVSFRSEAGGQASVDLFPGKTVSLAEDPEKPGFYKGTYVVQPGDFAETARLMAHFSSVSGFDADPVPSPGTFGVDARSRFAMTIDKTDLPADSSATARVKVKVTDANGNPVKDHQVKVTLSTTDEYTGLVGGGSTRSRDIAAANKVALGGAEVETRWKGVTDSWGEVEFDFKSGFAAKTIIIQAKDLTSGNVGVDYITSYKEASIDIALTAPISRAAARRGVTYVLKVEATRTELTADGRSRSVIRATLTDPNGTPVAGDPVAFSLSSPNGTLRVIQGATDASGVAIAEYTAGKKIGIVVVTATATLRNASGNVSIILLSDAPAKVYLKARPESLPADGNSRADISVKVTDINDNPNRDTKVEFKVAKGGGKMEFPDRTTDKFGDTANRYTAGTAPGIATLVATVRSRIPTEGELAKARNVIFVPFTPEGEEIKVTRWLKRVGETAAMGEPIVEYTVGRNPELRTLKAPYDCKVEFQHVEYWDTAQVGDTLAQISPVVIPGSTSPAPLPVNLAPRRR